MARHRAQHRLKKQRPQLKLDLSNPVWHLYWILPLAATVLIAVFTVTYALTPPEGEAEKAATAATLTRQNPATTERARTYLDKLDAEGIHVEPGKAIFYGEAVCAHRREYNTSLVGLTKQVEQELGTQLSRIQAHRLVDIADSELCHK